MSRCFWLEVEEFRKTGLIGSFVSKELYEIFETKWEGADDEEKEAMDSILPEWGAQFIKLWANWSCPCPYCGWSFYMILFDLSKFVELFFVFYLQESFRKCVQI